jgi:O-antigen/teichoic acid export membrane protein
VNALLVNLFFRVDVFIVQALKGDEALGVYDASYKLINLVTIVPAYVTLAIFPAMAQRAGDPAALERTLRSASYILVWLAWGIVAGVSAVGESTIRVLAGQEYLPESATLLRILIWFAPLSFLNGVIQYALVASERQRRIVPAFAAAVVSNLALNLAFVPAHGARAAAGATIATELVILIAFAILTRGSSVPAMTRTSIYRLARPTVAGVAAAAVAMVAAGRFGELVAAPLAALTFIGLSAAVGVAGPSERELLRRALRRSPVHT